MEKLPLAAITKPIRLSSLIKNASIVQETLTLNLVVEPATTMHLVDDLVSQLYPNLDLIITLQERATLIVTGIIKTTVSKQIIIRLQGDHSIAKATYHVLGKQTESIKISSIQQHQAPHTKSEFSVFSVLKQQATFRCSSLIFIEKQSTQSQAKQLNKNLLLSSKATAIACPKLEVLCHEVTCTHGSATSNFDKNLLFFLQSRGISNKTGKNLLIRAFLKNS
jgi:Fe-S cluster assembly scaffold protein SufB